ncbi:MAG TPA: hypothetical protein VFW31_03970 [Candidatus Angelobacter sp.]|nr:hypothetical protein [Candidatus Angelobacter sp.]
MAVPRHIMILAPWQPISGDRAADFDRELQREVSPGHPLFGVQAAAVAMTGSRDDVLFELTGHEYPLAHVHLTWSQKQMNDIRWPRTQFFASWEDWVREKLIPDHDEYNLL